jgi:hypothetical protein
MQPDLLTPHSTPAQAAPSSAPAAPAATAALRALRLHLLLTLARLLLLLLMVRTGGEQTQSTHQRAPEATAQTARSESPPQTAAHARAAGTPTSCAGARVRSASTGRLSATHLGDAGPGGGHTLAHVGTGPEARADALGEPPSAPGPQTPHTGRRARTFRTETTGAASGRVGVTRLRRTSEQPTRPQAPSPGHALVHHCNFDAGRRRDGGTRCRHGCGRGLTATSARRAPLRRRSRGTNTSADLCCSCTTRLHSRACRRNPASLIHGL